MPNVMSERKRLKRYYVRSILALINFAVIVCLLQSNVTQIYFRSSTSTDQARVAVLIVGELRFCFDLTYRCLEHFAEQDYDIFVYTHTDCNISHPRLVDKYIMNSQDIMKEELATDNFVPIFQFFKLSQVWLRLEKHEKSQNFQYSRVLKWRTDIVCETGLSNALKKLPQPESGVLYANSDMYFWGTRDTVKLISDLGWNLNGLTQATLDRRYIQLNFSSVAASELCSRIELLPLPENVVHDIRNSPKISASLQQKCGAKGNIDLCLEKMWGDKSQASSNPFAPKRETQVQYRNEALAYFRNMHKNLEMYKSHVTAKTTFITEFRGYFPRSPERFFAIWAYHHNITVKCFPSHEWITTEYLARA
jgi:hypothetical protein